MRIKVAQRLRPFSHKPGTKVLLPGTGTPLQIFPTLIRWPDKDVPIELSGPVKDFTVQLDLEKGCIHIWGHYKETYHRLKLASDEVLIENPERLSLGLHKAQEWEQVKRRADLREIFPFWLRMGQFVPQETLDTSSGTPALLNPCMEAIANNEKKAIKEAFLNLFHAGFSGILFPRLEDEEHLGLGVIPPAKDFIGSPLTLLTEGAKLIRSLFVTVVDHTIEILPVLPPEFHCGKMVSINCGTLGTLDMEWTKKKIRRMVFHSKVNDTIFFSFQKEIKRYRLNREKTLKSGAPIAIETGKMYSFDRFEQ